MSDEKEVKEQKHEDPKPVDPPTPSNGSDDQPPKP